MTITQLAVNENLADTLVERYIAAWNATDAAQRRTLVAQTWTESATYVDPLMQGTGHDGIDGLIAGVQAKFPGFRFARDGGVDVVQETPASAGHWAPTGRRWSRARISSASQTAACRRSPASSTRCPAWAMRPEHVPSPQANAPACRGVLH